jgi:hypothetical protein
VLSTCCNQIKTKVLNKVGTCDLSNVTVQISRLDGQRSQMIADDTLYILGSNLGGVGPERGLRGGGRRGWCEEWARSG